MIWPKQEEDDDRWTLSVNDMGGMVGKYAPRKLGRVRSSQQAGKALIQTANVEVEV